MIEILFLGFLWYQIIAIFGVSAGLHRYFAHNQFTASKTYEIVALYLAMLAGSRSPLGWIGAHRIHHQYSDTEKDPHSVKHMGWKVMYPILWDTGGPTGGDLRTVVRLMRNKIALFFHRNHFVLLAIPYLLLFVSVELFFFGYFIPASASQWAASYATLNHDENGPVDRGLLYSIFTGGEHKHIWHHNNPGDTSGEGWLNTVANMIAKKRVA